MFVLTLIRERHQINNAYVFKIPNVKILPDKKKNRRTCSDIFKIAFEITWYIIQNLHMCTVLTYFLNNVLNNEI